MADAIGTPVAPSGSGDAIVERAGYKPELRRSLKFFSMFAIAFSIISITTGIFLNYGFGLQHWGPASIWTWPIVGVGNTAIALVCCCAACSGLSSARRCSAWWP
jgi:amino acid transporter